MSSADPRPVAVITGAHGGIGIACARVFGRRYRLVLTDRDAGRLEALRAQLAADGADVAAVVAGDLTSGGALPQVVDEARAAGRLGALIHAAGLSPALAGWEAILEVNLMATLRVLDAFEALLEPGAVGVLLASIAAHTAHITPAMSAAIETVLDGGDKAPLEALVAGPDGEGRFAGAAYGISKYAVKRLAEKRARAWAGRGARIVAVSPGLVSTPMGQKEVASAEAAAQLIRSAPIPGFVGPLDIANAAEFLCSDLARFITGCDLLLDGGLVGDLTSARIASGG